MFSSLTGYRCADSQYQCNNGICIDKYKRCDGVKDDCIDGSDEDRCPCLTNQFTCFDGSCVDVSKLCNRKLNCESEDEMRCDDGNSLFVSLFQTSQLTIRPLGQVNYELIVHEAVSTPSSRDRVV